MALGGGYFKTSYEGDLALVDTRLRRVALATFVVVLLVLPRFASSFLLDLLSQVARAGGNTCFTIPPARIAGFVVRGTVGWYYALVIAAAIVLILVVNLQRSRAGRAWMAIRDRDMAAASVGIDVARYKLAAFVWSSAVTAVAGTLFAYQRGFVSVEAFGFFVAVEYIAMIIIGGLGTALGAVLGAALVALLPYGIDAFVASVSPGAADYYIFPAKFGAFGLLMALFLIFEPLGLVGIWRRVRNWLFLWPFRHRPLRASS